MAECFKPSLTLTVNNAQGTLEDGLRAIQSGHTEIDLADLTAVDSAAVATLLAWRRAAQAQGSELMFSNLPANLKSLIQLYGVEDLLAPSIATESTEVAQASHSPRH